MSITPEPFPRAAGQAVPVHHTGRFVRKCRPTRTRSVRNRSRNRQPSA